MNKLTLVFTFLLVVSILQTASCYGQSVLPGENHCPKEKEEDTSWNLSYSNEFNDAGVLDDFVTDGFAELSVENGNLFIKTFKTDLGGESVVWLDKKFDGDVKIQFRIKGDTRSRMILYFNARGEVINPARENAAEVHYAGTERMEMYSVGFLRDDEKICNVRHIGGNSSEAYIKYAPSVKTRQIYHQETIIAKFESPFYGRPGQWFDCEVQMTGNRMQIVIDGEKVVDVEDIGNVGGYNYSWKPLTDGGYFGFRNFRPAKTRIDDLKIYTK